MESRAFHICPFCQSASPASLSRCAHCRRSLVGLPLPLYGSELDDGLARPAAGEPLADLPLRPSTPPPAVAVTAPMALPVASSTRTRGATPPRARRADRRRLGRGAKIALGTAIIGVALVGGWLVRAQDLSREPAPARTRARAATAGPVTRPSSPPARVPMEAAPLRRAPPPPAATPATTAARVVSRPPSPAAPPAVQVYTVHPDVREDAAEPAASETVDTHRRPAAEPIDEAQAQVLARFRRAFERRDALAERAARLRARLEAPVARDGQDVGRLQDDLAATEQQLDRAEAEVARLRRALTADR